MLNSDADRVNKYDVWDYAEGQDSYRISMLVDLAQPSDKVTASCLLQYGSNVVIREDIAQSYAQNQRVYYSNLTSAGSANRRIVSQENV